MGEGVRGLLLFFDVAYISFSLIKRLNAQRSLVLSVGTESTMNVFCLIVISLVDCTVGF